MFHFLCCHWLSVCVCVCCGRHGNVKLLTDEPGMAVKVTLLVNECVSVHACVHQMHALLDSCLCQNKFSTAIANSANPSNRERSHQLRVLLLLII